MNKNVIEVSVRAVLPMNAGCALFLGNAQKCFIIHMHEQAGYNISATMRGAKSSRPLTHELMGRTLKAFGAKVERVVINDVQEHTFFARLIMSAQNQLHQKKLVELDARPSDAVVLALQDQASIYVAEQVWDTVQDMTAMLEEIKTSGLDPIQIHSKALGFADAAALASTIVGDDEDEDLDEDDFSDLDDEELDDDEAAEIDKLLSDLPGMDDDEEEADDDDEDDIDLFDELDDEDEVFDPENSGPLTEEDLIEIEEEEDDGDDLLDEDDTPPNGPSWR
jgi:uncharacterized protein